MAKFCVSGRVIATGHLFTPFLVDAKDEVHAFQLAKRADLAIGSIIPHVASDKSIRLADGPPAMQVATRKPLAAPVDPSVPATARSVMRELGLGLAILVLFIGGLAATVVLAINVSLLLGYLVAYATGAMILGIMAAQRNRDAAAWGFIGGLFFLPSLIILMLCPYLCPRCRRPLSNKEWRARTCPQCGNLG